MLSTTPSILSSLQTGLLVWAVVVHLVADWLLQTEWMAVNKTNLLHPAAWAHSAVHALCLLIVFPWTVALGLGISHLIIDTRRPLYWWMTRVKGMPRASTGIGVVEILLDQVFHIMTLAVAVLLLSF